MTAKNYIVVGGIPYQGYTGTITYTDIKVIGAYETQEEADKSVKKNWDSCNGLLCVIDVANLECEK